MTDDQALHVDVDVDLDVVGTGPVPLLLLHGGSGRRQWFDAMSALLTEDARMVRPDLPGHGGSPPTPGRYRLQDSAAAAAAVLDADGAGPAWVFGHSHGAHVAAVLAADRPDLVRGLLLGDAPMSRDRMRAHQEDTAAMNRAWRELTDASLSPDERTRHFLDLPVAPGPGAPTIRDLFGPDHPYVAEMVTSLGHHDGDFLDAVLLRFDETYERLTDDLLEAIDVPVVLLRADPAAGGLVTDDDVAHLREHVPHLRVRRLVGVGHGLQLQDPEQVARAVRESIA
ncbi:alpha/beta fold hydrolase [Nocardioides xinjiangensis]|uniref:alpha/beta fold hydrolase n=1 Tax=Nocardioides xinjiangensis TaxID=2817376 RepID=UPI001B30092A|nr:MULTISPECIES: alpha/beta hydrolase [unclassified Nocardioides]